MAYLRIPGQVLHVDGERTWRHEQVLVFDALEDALEIYRHIKGDFTNIQLGVGRHHRED